MKAKFELKENVEPIFKMKRNVPFASLKLINDRLDKMDILSKVDYNDWASP